MRIISSDFIEPSRLKRRRRLFFTSVFVLTSLATWFMADLLWNDNGIRGVEWPLLILFVVLFSQIAIGFVTA
jgi:membrane glycosyltransferase